MFLQSLAEVSGMSVLRLAMAGLNLLFELTPVLELVSEVLTVSVSVVSTGVLRKLGSMISGTSVISRFDISRDHRRNSHAQGENDGMRRQ
ncbi:MAG: hypothetical protein ACK526_06135 [Planctomyces sp.]